MPHRALIERRPWLAASLIAATAFAWLQDSALPGLYLLVLAFAPYALLAAYAGLRHRGRDTRTLATMLVLLGAGWAIAPLWPSIAAIVLWLGFLAGLGLFLGHRTLVPAPDRKVAAVALLLGTPTLFTVAAGTGFLFFGLALGAMAASAWVSTFPRGRTATGATLVVVGTLLAITEAPGDTARLLAWLAWPVAYVGSMILATGVTGELRTRSAFEDDAGPSG